MDNASGDQILIRIAVFGITVSILCTILISALVVDATSGDYSYDEVSEYRADLVDFSGETMLNQSPWVLTHVYTPWDPSTDPASHTDADGWLYGEDVEYDYTGKAADIRLDSGQKSSVALTYTEDVSTYRVVSGTKWWYYEGHRNIFESAASWISDVVSNFSDPYEYENRTASQWNYTGYRYVFDPTLPFTSGSASDHVSTVDGALSLVWYTYNGQEGLSGGLDIYGGEVLLASYSATDIVADYDSTSGYATTYDFNFQGTHLTLSVRFDQDVIEAGTTLMQAWTEGDWSMAISSLSAGNFFDIDNSNAFSVTAGSMIDTFIQIFTFDVPSIDNPWMDLIMWLIVALPMMVALLCITLRLVNGFRVI